MLLGNDQEPAFDHIHIIPRGNTEIQFFGNIKLGGPSPGSIFDMRGRSKTLGNNTKRPWDYLGYPVWRRHAILTVKYALSERFEEVFGQINSDLKQKHCCRIIDQKSIISFNPAITRLY